MTVGPTTALAVIAAVAVLCIVLMAGVAILIEHRNRRTLVLTPADEDDDPGHSVWIVTVRYRSTETVERLVLVANTQRSTSETRSDLEDSVPGADIIDIEQVPLFKFDPSHD